MVSVEENSVRLLVRGGRMAKVTSQPSQFFEFLWSWGGGGEWMWTNVVSEGKDLDWVVAALRNGTAMWMTEDEDEPEEVDPRVCGAGSQKQNVSAPQTNSRLGRPDNI